MKKVIWTMLVSLIFTSPAFANPLLLKCTTESSKIVIDVDSLVGQGCHQAVYQAKSNLRYQVELCDGKDALGMVQVRDIDGNWVDVERLATGENCYTWRKIQTDYPCDSDRHGHNGRSCN